ncbi:unnamed protein product [Sphagnum troendelagicum]|uniref:cellulase n=1 Tax=Sphagnum troendelagicum TaxID=128251 RepID=A0ABP0TNH0_9BRYO
MDISFKFSHTLSFLQMMAMLGATESAATVSFNYSDALAKSILFYEGQRSGKLPPDQRMTWRGDSALNDGNVSHVDLSGGYYDAGDNVKYQFPMAFTITLLSWSVIEYERELVSAGQMQYAQQAIKWGTDYFLKAITGPTQIWVQVGDPNTDHNCWERPEDMDTSRITYQINSNSPGTEVAAETAAALAAASIVFANTDPIYAEKLLDTAMTVFDFADGYRGTFTGACPFYCSASGYNDELLWGAAWLLKASNDTAYLQYVVNNRGLSSEMNEFSWDNKNAGAQILLSKMYFSGQTELQSYSRQAASFVCHVLPNNPWSQVSYTPGGLLYVRDGANTQYVTGSSFLIAIFADYLTSAGDLLSCGDTSFTPRELQSHSKGQVDYILGNNPENMSYMAGFGTRYPNQVHHRSASIPSIHTSPTQVVCGEGFVSWFPSSNPNPNVLTGAIVGGPNRNDVFDDSRRDSSCTEPTTYINSGMVGLLAKLSSQRN